MRFMDAPRCRLNIWIGRHGTHREPERCLGVLREVELAAMMEWIFDAMLCQFTPFTLGPQSVPGTSEETFSVPGSSVHLAQSQPARLISLNAQSGSTSPAERLRFGSCRLRAHREVTCAVQESM